MLAEGTEGGTHICQQYGAFLANADDLAGPASPILLAAALWQTRWSQAFELARALKNLEPRRLDRLRARRLGFGAGRLPRMNYVIGHGLAIQRSFLTELEGFTTRWHNEAPSSDCTWRSPASLSFQTPTSSRPTRRTPCAEC